MDTEDSKYFRDLVHKDNELHQKLCKDGWQFKAHMAYQALIDLADKFREGHDWGGLNSLSKILEMFEEQMCVSRHIEVIAHQEQRARLEEERYLNDLRRKAREGSVDGH